MSDLARQIARRIELDLTAGSGWACIGEDGQQMYTYRQGNIR